MKKEEFLCQGDDKQYLIKIGQNAKDNWDIIDESNLDDLWFHVEGSPSSHVVLSVGDQKPHRGALVRAAVLCKQHSKRKSDKKVPIIYTKIKNIKKGDAVGSVICSDEKTIII